MAAAVKAASVCRAFPPLARGVPTLLSTWHEAVWWLAALTMIVGNLVALSPKNIKRLLPIRVSHTRDTSSLPWWWHEPRQLGFMFYLFAYTMATLGAFAGVIALGEGGRTT